MLITLHSNLWSQDNLWSMRQDILEEYRGYADTAYTYTISDHTSSITVKISGLDSLVIEHFFRLPGNKIYDDESICDSLVIKLLCNDCVTYHISELAGSKERKWHKYSDSLYISRRWVSKFMPPGKAPNIYSVPVMEIETLEQQTQVTLYIKTFTKEEWKDLLK